MQDRHDDLHEGVKLRSVRRRLFQDDDNEQQTNLNSAVQENVANYLFEEARRSRENARERWNFDFEKEEPLPGRYEWVKLDRDGNEVPCFLKPCVNGESTRVASKEHAESCAGESSDVNNESAESA